MNNSIALTAMAVCAHDHMIVDGDVEVPAGFDDMRFRIISCWLGEGSLNMIAAACQSSARLTNFAHLAGRFID